MAKVDLEAVARLARLEIAPEAKAELQQDMDAIVDYIQLLQELDVSGIEPTAHAAELINVWREDIPGTPYGCKAMLANAPATVKGETIKVPPVLPGEGMS